jgi:hypothetical protein
MEVDPDRIELLPAGLEFDGLLEDLAVPTLEQGAMRIGGRGGGGRQWLLSKYSRLLPPRVQVGQA